MASQHPLPADPTHEQRVELAGSRSRLEVRDALDRQQDRGELHHKSEPLAMPSESTINSIAREVAREDSRAELLCEVGHRLLGRVAWPSTR